MARYIDADKLKDEYYELYHHGTMAVKSVLPVFVDLLGNAPAADVAEVKHGEWVQRKHKIFGNNYDYVCSVCDCDYALAEYNFCPNCGAKMDGERK